MFHNKSNKFSYFGFSTGLGCSIIVGRVMGGWTVSDILFTLFYFFSSGCGLVDFESSAYTWESYF